MAISLISPGSVQFNDGTVQTVNEVGGYGLARTSASLNISSQATFIKVPISTLVEGSGITFTSASNRFVVTTAGVYVITGVVRFAPGVNDGGYLATASIFKNGIEAVRGDTLLGWNQSYIQSIASTSLNLAVNDYIELYGAFISNGTGQMAFQYDTTVLASRLEIARVRTTV